MRAPRLPVERYSARQGGDGETAACTGATGAFGAGLVKVFRGTGRRRDRLTVAPGERLGLLGPNGAGKTTTLLMLSGRSCPTGVVEIAGTACPGGAARPWNTSVCAGYLPMPDRLKVREALGTSPVCTA